MTPAADSARVKRIKYWILGLTLIPGTFLLIAGFTRHGLGYLTGGALIFMNLVGTERSVRAFTGGGGTGRVAAALFYLGKIVVTGAVIAVVLIREVVSPLALMAGLITLLLALVFDIFIFPVDKGKSNNGEAKEP
ncbi:MAG: ATP synthase subunit I [bacterium]|nr:MAG: ATP synthase subunit I [bacterium]